MLIIIALCSCKQDCYNDLPGRTAFVKQLHSMYEVEDITSHFPSSWNESCRSDKNWTSYYLNSDDDSIYHNFRCFCYYACDLDVSQIDALTNRTTYLYRSNFNSDSLLKIDVVYMKHIESYHQIVFDTIKAPIYDFRDVNFKLGEQKDSIYLEFECSSGYFNNNKQVLPEDLLIYVVDAQPGNFWKNKELADLEPRPVLPEKWKHGYSRGIGVSRSCSRVCWWVMAW